MGKRSRTVTTIIDYCAKHSNAASQGTKDGSLAAFLSAMSFPRPESVASTNSPNALSSGLGPGAQRSQDFRKSVGTDAQGVVRSADSPVPSDLGPSNVHTPLPE